MSREECLEKRLEFLQRTVSTTSSMTLAGLLLSPVKMAELAIVELERRVIEGECEPAEIKEWIVVFANLGTNMAEKQTKELYEILRKGKYKLSSDDLENFVLAFGRSRSFDDVGMDALHKFCTHEDTTEEQVLNAIKESDNSRRIVFNACVQNFELSFVGYVRCLIYPHIGKDAMKTIKGLDLESLDFDYELVKKLLFEAIPNKQIVEDVFEFISKLKMFSSKDLSLLEEEKGLKRLAEKARLKL